MARGRANWDSEITKIFLDLCIAEKEKFNFNKKKGLTKAGWQNVYRSFREKTKRDYDSKQLQNKFNSLKRQYMADKYYLVDSGYPLRDGYMAPYRKNRYHLNEFEEKGPENIYEIFNYHHSCLRNVVERSFGVLKNKWQILKGIPLYSKEKQSKIIISCFALHNFSLDNNDGSMVVQHGSDLSRAGQQIEPSQDWLAATADDNIGTVRDWIATGLYYGLA